MSTSLVTRVYHCTPLPTTSLCSTSWWRRLLAMLRGLCMRTKY